MKTFKIYAPTISGAKEMFSDYEKDMARDNEIENQIDDLREEKLKGTADCHASPMDSCSHCQELGLER